MSMFTAFFATITACASSLYWFHADNSWPYTANPKFLPSLGEEEENPKKKKNTPKPPNPEALNPFQASKSFGCFATKSGNQSGWAWNFGESGVRG